MFCDLVDSTPMAARLDPEDMRQVIRLYQNTVAGEVARFEGHVAKFMGDGVLAYFGWPRTHEDEAERATRAGLAIVQAIAQAQTLAGEGLQVRIGIATGLVVVGDLIGEGAAQEHAAIGETPNLAARLQAAADPGRVVIAEATRLLIGNLFVLQELGNLTLKGIAEPAVAFAVLSERPIESRFAARQSQGLTPIVARDQELAFLLERWRRTKAGEGQMILVSGEAGIGKSRITEALIAARTAVMAAVAAIDMGMRRMATASAACSRLMTIPGVGQLTALAFVAAIDDPSRIRRSRDIGAYLGLVPRRHQSGEVDYVGSISKCGDRRVRTLLYEAANVMLTRYKGQLKLKDWAFAIAKRSTMRKARVALARRLGIIMQAMLRDETEFVLA